MNIYKSIKTFILLVPLVGCLVVAAPVWARGAPEDVMIIFGGVGPVSKHAQPVLMDMLKTTGPLEKTLNQIKKHIRDKAHFGYSQYPVVTNFKEFKNTIEHIRGGRRLPSGVNEAETIRSFLASGDQALVLSLAGSLEYVLELKDRRHFFVMVSALLTVPGNGNVVMQGSKFVELIINNNENFSKKEGFAEAYRRAFDGALKTLERAVAQDSGSDPIMVTAVDIYDTDVRRLFNVTGANINNKQQICEGRRLCPNNDKMCSLLGALLSQGVSSSLIAKGKVVIPPLNWRYGAEDSENAILLNVFQGIFGNKGKAIIKIAVDPKSATEKLVVSLKQVKEKELGEDKKYYSIRGYKAYLEIASFETRKCNHFNKENNYRLQSSGEPILQNREKDSEGRAETASLRRVYHFLAIKNAIQKFSGN